MTISDSLLIIDSFIQKSLLPYFTKKAPLEPDWFKISNPYFWHPFKGIIVTVTIYLMVAISAERFRAVCYPLSKRQVSTMMLVDILYGLWESFDNLILFIDLYQYSATIFVSVPVQIRFRGNCDSRRFKTSKVFSFQIDLHLRITGVLDYANHRRSKLHTFQLILGRPFYHWCPSTCYINLFQP